MIDVIKKRVNESLTNQNDQIVLDSILLYEISKEIDIKIESNDLSDKKSSILSDERIHW